MLKISKTILILIAFSYSLFAISNESFRYRSFVVTDKHAINFNNTNISIEDLALQLTKPFNETIDKYRVIYMWVAIHIDYDSVCFKNGSVFCKNKSNQVLLNRKATCIGYANITKSLCIAAGLESEIIIGYAKGSNYQHANQLGENQRHAWNSMTIDNKNLILDATWASSTKDYDFYFDPSPIQLAYSHYPDEKKWLRLKDTFSLRDFLTLPLRNKEVLKINKFNPYVDLLKADSKLLT